MDDKDPAPLEYDPLSQQPNGPRPKWVYFLVAIYVLLLTGLLTSPAWFPWATNSPDMRPGLAICVSILALAGMTLMIVPVRKVRRRPITRRSVWFPIVGSGLLMSILIFGGSIALAEFANENSDVGNQIMVAAGTIWIFWSGILIWLTFSIDPASIGAKLHRWLIAGSVLELLVAVPTHIVVRRRGDCCAGMATGIGICIGVVVMFIAFGPSVFLLYYRRRKQITGK